MILFEHFYVFLINGGLLKDTSDGVAVTLGIAAAAAGLSILAFSEVNLMSYYLHLLPSSEKAIIHYDVSSLT